MALKRTKQSVQQIKSGIKAMFQGMRNLEMGTTSFIPSLLLDIGESMYGILAKTFGYPLSKLKDAVDGYLMGARLRFEEMKDHVKNYARQIKASGKVYGRLGDAVDEYADELGIDYLKVSSNKGRGHFVAEASFEAKKAITVDDVERIANRIGQFNKRILNNGHIMFENDKMSIIVDPTNPRRIRIRSWEKWDAS